MSLTVLLVEDNAANRALVREVLGVAGHRVEEAAGLTQAHRLLDARGGDFDVVLLDIQLPGGDGRELLRRIRATPALGGATVLAVTAQAMQGDREDLLAAGFDGYIPKPIDTRTFAATVEAAVRDKESQP